MRTNASPSSRRAPASERRMPPELRAAMELASEALGEEEKRLVKETIITIFQYLQGNIAATLKLLPEVVTQITTPWTKLEEIDPSPSYFRMMINTPAAAASAQAFYYTGMAEGDYSF